MNNKPKHKMTTCSQSDKKVLLLVWNDQLYYFNKINIDNINVFEVKRKHKKRINRIIEWFNTMLHRIDRKLNGIMYRFPITRSWYYSFLKRVYGDWFKSINDYSKIIVFDTVLCFDNYILDVLSHFTNQDKYLCFWNTLNVIKDKDWFLKLANNSAFKVYSFDKNDCTLFGFNYINAPYYKNVVLPPRTDRISVFFCGANKNRMDQLVKLYLFLDSIEITSRIVIFNGDNKQEGFIYRTDWMNYDEYLQNISNCDFLIDINQNGQSGLSMRVMESIFFDKKLITTNPYILEADFYDESKVFFIDDCDNINKEKFLEFYEKKIDPYPVEIKDKYDISNWVDQFI